MKMLECLDKNVHVAGTWYVFIQHYNVH